MPGESRGNQPTLLQCHLHCAAVRRRHRKTVEQLQSMPCLPLENRSRRVVKKNIQTNYETRDRVTQTQKSVLRIVGSSRSRIRRQGRQSPQALPALSRILLQQNAPILKSEKMEFSFSLDFWPLSLSRQRVRIPGLAKGSHRAANTQRLSGQANHRSKLHQRRIQKPRVGSLDISKRQIPNDLASRELIHRRLQV